MHEFDSNGTKVLIAGRQAGKTTALIRWAKGDVGRVVVAGTQVRVEHLRRGGLAADQAVPYHAATNFLRGRQGLEVGVDDVLDYVYADLGVFPAFVTLDGEPASRPQPTPDPLDLTAETPAELLLEAALYYRSENERLLRIIRAQLDEEINA